VAVANSPTYFVDQLQIKRAPNIKVLKGGLAGLLLSIIWSRLNGRRALFFLAPGGNVGEKELASYLANQAYNALLLLLKTVGVEIIQFGTSYEKLGPRYARVVAGRAKSMSRLVV